MLPSYFLPPSSPCTRTPPNLAAVAAVLHHSDLDIVHGLQFPHLPTAGPFVQSIARERPSSVLSGFRLPALNIVARRQHSGTWRHHLRISIHRSRWTSPCKWKNTVAVAVTPRFGRLVVALHNPNPAAFVLSPGLPMLEISGIESPSVVSHIVEVKHIEHATHYLLNTVVRPFSGAPRRAAEAAEAVGSI
ncbi:hypothetical protein B0H14DRAFT_2619718 [Mycena olivaceomarginata]|nr:hypothetical protein B0H14DRAFT_2619718 [Mycena olivaceomarginata]